MLGPVLPYLRQTEHTSYVAGALHQVTFAIGGMTAGILAIHSGAPRRRTIALGLAGAAAAGLLLGYGDTFAITTTATFLISAFATTALIRVWALLADLHHRHRAVAMTEGEISVSLAGIAMPVVVSVCAATALGWRFSFVIAFVLVLAAAVAVAVVRMPDVPRPPRTAQGSGHERRHSPRHTLVTIFAVVGMEFTLSFWAASYLHDDVGISQDAAVALVSVLYAANLVGRVVVSRLARRLPTPVVLELSLTTALAGTPILLAANGLVLAGIGLFVAGVGIGGAFPLASALHVAASGRTADHALGQTLTVAGVGQIVGPLAAGVLAQAIGLRLALLVVPALILLAAVTVRCGRRTRRHGFEG